MEIGVLGPLHVIDGGNPLPLGGPKQRAVLGLLVAGSGRTVSVDEVVEGVWGDAPPKSVLSSLHSYISHLRSDAGLTIERNGDGYRLITETDTVDALAFEALIGQARDVVETDAARAADLIAQALDLWRGHPYADLPDMLALEPEKKRLDHLRFGALDLEIEAELVLGRNTRAAERLERLIADHPFHEGLRAAHMLVLYRQGRQVAALNLYQDVRRLLLDELGVEPSPALQAMEHRILIQDPSLLLQPSRSGENGAVVPGPPGRNPYKGLAAFDIDDARDFHGRDDEIDELVKLVHAHRFVLVVGPSGSGKSSLVRAGLLPALADDAIPGSVHWPVTVINPGADPLTAVGAALDQPASRTTPDDRLVVIDQFEELYLLADTDTERAVVDALISAVDNPAGDNRIRVVATLRADFFHRPLADHRLGPLIRSATLAVAVPDAHRLARAIEQPAADVGLQLEAGLTSQIVADLEGRPAALPLLQFTMTELAQASTSGRITLGDYRDQGGVSGSIGQRAATIYGELGPEAREVARQVFLSLVTVTREADDVRRRVTRSELENMGFDPALLTQVLNRFGGARLLTFDHEPSTHTPSVEVAHEAVLREWRQLAHWIAERRDGLAVRHRLQLARQEWDDAGRPDDALPAGGRLVQFEECVADPDIVVTDDDRRFIARAVEQRDRWDDERRRRRRNLTWSFAAAAVVASVLAGAAWIQRGAAQREAARAEARGLILEAERNIDVDPELAIMLTSEAIDAVGGPEQAPVGAVDVMRRALANNKVLGHVPGGVFVDLDPTGSMMVTQAEDPSDGMAVWDPATSTLLGTIPQPAGSVFSARFIGPEHLVVIAFVDSSSTDGTNRAEIRRVTLGAADSGRFETATTATITRLDVPDWVLVPMALDPTGRYLAWLPSLPDNETGSPGAMEVIDLETGRTVLSLPDALDCLPAFTADGGRLAYLAAGPHPTIKVIALERGEGSGPVTGADDGVVSDREPGEIVATIGDLSIVPLTLTFSPDASRVAYATENEVAVGAVGSGDSAPGRELWVQPDISRAGVPLWSSDGRMVLTFGEGVVARLSAEDGGLLPNLLGDRGSPRDRAVVPGSATVAVAAESRVTLLETSLAPREELEGFASVLPVSVKGRVDRTGRLLFHNTQWEFAVQSVEGGTVHIHHRHDQGPNYFQFAVASMDVGFVAGYDDTGTVPVNKLWSTDGFDVVFTSEAAWSIRGISRAGDLVVLGREGQPARLVRTDTGEVVHELEVGNYAHRAFFTPDDRYVLIGNNGTGPPSWRLWDVASGEQVNSFGSSAAESGLVANFSPDGSHLVLGRYDGIVVVYDAAKILAGVDWDEAMIRSVEAHDGLIIQTEISPDGRLLATNAWDEPAKVWRLDTGEPVGEFGGTTEIRTITFHPTEPWVYVHDLGQVTVHTLDVAELVTIAQGTVTRPMTNDECTRYLGRPCP